MPTEVGLSTACLDPILGRHGHDASNLLQILRELQDCIGYLPADAITYLADKLAIPRVRIESVASFYSFLNLQPRGEYRVLFSDNITDRMLGSAELMQQMCQQLWAEPGKVSEDGLVSINTTSCTGMCDQGPALLVNGRAITRLTHQRVQEIAQLIRNRTQLDEWPADFFRVEDNIRRNGLLLDNKLAPGEVLRAALARGADKIVEAIKQSALRGRGGAGFPTGLKWEGCRNAKGSEHYVVCNADEGEPGTFKDRVLLTRQADLVFEGMTLCALAVGAKQGFLYLRGEYHYLLEHARSRVAAPPRCESARDEHTRPAGLRFRHQDPSRRRRLYLRRGIGADRIAGRQARRTAQPPAVPGDARLPAAADRVDNVETFCQAAAGAAHGRRQISRHRHGEIHRQQTVSVSGDCPRPGIYEYPFGVSVREVLAGLRRGEHARGAGQRAFRHLPVAEHEFDRSSPSRTFPPQAPSWCSTTAATCSRSHATSCISSRTRAAASARRAASALSLLKQSDGQDRCRPWARSTTCAKSKTSITFCKPPRIAGSGTPPATRCCTRSSISAPPTRAG